MMRHSLRTMLLLLKLLVLTLAFLILAPRGLGTVGRAWGGDGGGFRAGGGFRGGFGGGGGGGG